MIYSNCLNSKSTYHNLTTENFEMKYQVHSHHTRNSNKFHIKKVNYTYAKTYVRYSITSLLNKTHPCITDKFVMHSVHGIINYVKQYLLNHYVYLYL